MSLARAALIPRPSFRSAENWRRSGNCANGWGRRRHSVTASSCSKWSRPVRHSFIRSITQWEQTRSTRSSRPRSKRRASTLGASAVHRRQSNESGRLPGGQMARRRCVACDLDPDGSASGERDGPGVGSPHVRFGLVLDWLLRRRRCAPILLALGFDLVLHRNHSAAVWLRPISCSTLHHPEPVPVPLLQVLPRRVVLRLVLALCPVGPSDHGDHLRRGRLGHVEALAAALIPDPSNVFSQSGADFFFRQSARTLIVSLLQAVKSREPGDIPKLLALPRAKLREALRGTSAEELIDPGAHEQGAGIVATAFNATNPFRYLTGDGEQAWSALEWAQSRAGWVFLTSTEDSREAALPLQ